MIIIDKFSIKRVNKIKWVIEKKNNDKRKENNWENKKTK